MPARSTDGKSRGNGVVEKLRVRRTPIRTTNKRARNVAGGQLQRSSGMIVTMSVEQSGGIVKTSECVTASHTRQVSTTSTLFSPLGISIGVMCESTTENKEVIVDYLKDDARAALNWNGSNETRAALDWNGGNETNSCTLDFRKSLHFLDDQQFHLLCEFNIKNIQQLLNIPLRKLLEINLRTEQWQALITKLQNEMCSVSKPMDLSAENIETLKNIQEELEKLDANDDDDEQPLVIDESIPIIEENKSVSSNEQSLDAIEENFSKIKNAKIPQTRAALKGVKTELTDIITELNKKEIRLVRQLQRKKQSNEITNKNGASNENGTEEIVTTTNETGKPGKPAKRVKGTRAVKRRRNLKNNLKTDNTEFNQNTTHVETISYMPTEDLKATSACKEPKTPVTIDLTPEISALNDVSQSSQSFDVVSSANDERELPLLDASTSKNSSTFGRGVLFIHPQSVVIVHEDVAKSSGLIHTPIIKKRRQRGQLNYTSTNNNAVVLDVSESNIISASPQQLFATSNLATISNLPLIPPDIDDETKTVSKGYTNCKEVVQTISKHLKPISAAPTQPTKLQPTVLLKKLPTPKRAKERNVDADSTTASIEQIDVKKANAIETITEENSLCEEPSTIAPVKKSKLVKPQKDDKKHISDDADEQVEICASKDTESTEKSDVIATENMKSTVLEQHSANESKQQQNEPTKSVTPESPLFESITTESDDLEESAIILDHQNSTNKQKDIGQDSPSTSKKLIEDVNIQGSKKHHQSFVNSTPIVSENVKDSRPQLASQRCIEFDKKPQEKSNGDYDSYDADSIVTISPLSPISSGIASPINSKVIFSDFRNAMEIDAYCAGMIYLLKEIDMPSIAVNKPDNADLLMRKNPSDPRLFKYLKKNPNVIQMPSSLTVYNKAVTQIDPRRPTSIYNNDTFVSPRPTPEPTQTTPNMLLYGCLQRSPWYQSLMSTMKIQINQTISILVRAINNFQQMRLEDPYAVFDIFKLYCAGELLEIMDNLGLFVDVNGVIAEKKSSSSFAGRSYGCSSVVNATYSFIQPVVEPSTVTVQHQQMRSFTAPQQSFTAAAAAHTTFPTPQTPFISCYIDPPQMAIEKPYQYQNQQQQQPEAYNQRPKQYNQRPQPEEHQQEYNQRPPKQYNQRPQSEEHQQEYNQRPPKQYNQRPQPEEYQQEYNQRPKQYNQRPQQYNQKPSRGKFGSSGPRRHCGLKVPYGAPRGRSSVSPSKETPYSHGAPQGRSSVSPAKETPYSYNATRARSPVSPVKDEPSPPPPARSSVSPVKETSYSDSSPPPCASVSPVRQQPRCADSEEESWD